MRNRSARFVACLALAVITLRVAAAEPTTPKVLPPWTRGTLDIHQLSTGRGNSALLVLPDGTTLLLDAGAAGDGTNVPDSEPRPSASYSAGAAIVGYIQRLLGADAHIDYAVLTHYHADHMGQVTPSSAASASSAYRLSGITEVGDRLRIGTLIDRGDAFLPPAADDATFANYHAFIAEQQRTHELRHETIRVGRADQIVLRRAPSEFPTFEVRNVAANGDVWTGERDDVRHVFPALAALATEDRPSENMCSIGLRIRYGRFDFFSGGDMPGVPDAGAPAWQAVELPVAKAIGPTDVHVVNHHGSIDPESAEFLQTLRSRVMILPAWSATHPSQDVLKRMLSTRLYPAPHDIFVTTLRAPTAASIGSRVSQLKADHGHIVVRVAPGGATYSVYVLDDIKDDGSVLATFGPYTSE
jgi:beta-lactamase superfamily II metal-dependent hydrolase